jgi:3-hydroxyacyl-CoA dehydrogenase
VIARAAVIGAGVMGSEIAQPAAAGGVEVVLVDADPAASSGARPTWPRSALAGWRAAG